MLICPSVCSSDQRYYNVLLRILWILSFFHSIFRLWYYICVVCMCIVYLWLYVLEFKVVSHVQVLQCGIVNNLPTNDSMLFCYNGFMIRIKKTWHVWTLCCFVLLNLQTTRHISKTVHVLVQLFEGVCLLSKSYWRGDTKSSTLYALFPSLVFINYL